MEETNKTSNKCKSASLLNPVIAHESTVDIVEAKDKEQLQVGMKKTKLTKECLPDNREICSKVPKNLTEKL